jgi:hypothetical protein
VSIRRSKKPPVIKEEALKSLSALEIAGKEEGSKGLGIPSSLLAWEHHNFDGLTRENSFNALLDIS